MSVFFTFFSIAIFLLLFNAFFSIVFTKPSLFTTTTTTTTSMGLTSSYFSKIFISFKTFIFSNVLCLFLFSFSHTLFFLLIFLSHFFPISWLSLLYIWVLKKKPENDSTISGANATNATLQTTLMLARYQYRFRQTLLPTHDIADVQYEHPCWRSIGDDVSRYCSSLLFRGTFPAPPDRFQVQPHSARCKIWTHTHSPVFHRTSSWRIHAPTKPTGA